jgi:hypothetical protein
MLEQFVRRQVTPASRSLTVGGYKLDGRVNRQRRFHAEGNLCRPRTGQ